MVRNLLKMLLLAGVCLSPLMASAVTDKEMEQARVIAAKSYIRYVNDGSGYLDEINPTTLADLEKALKPKEKENIKAFLAIPVPKDYKDWDKQKLVEYWAVTAFQDKGLQEKGRGGRIRARSLINKMTIAAPGSAAAAAAPATPQASSAQGTTPAAGKPETAQPVDTASLENGNPDEALSGEFSADEEDIDIPQADNYTWVYIMILGILVVVVIVLIVYAVNVMKKNSNEQYRGENSDNEDASELREKYEAAMADKDVEIAMLTKKLETSNRQNSELKTKIDALVGEISALRASGIPGGMPKDGDNTEAVRKPSVPRSIYLGRANVKGIFVRADRTLNVGHSVFVLDTTDGFSGTFQVADSPAAWSLALSNPQEYLSSACTGTDLEATTGMNRIVTESSGTAIFEGGCWRVIRKAKIRYEA